MSQQFTRVQMALATCRTEKRYEGLKLAAEKLTVVEQFAIVDSFISCRRRLVDMGVL